MNEAIAHGTGYVGYEYKEITIRQEQESLYADGYQNFGWELEDTATPAFTGNPANMSQVTMKFKRDRKIRNKAELTRLQRQFDALANEIVRMEQSKTLSAATIAYIIGIVGTAFMAGAMFAYLGGMIPLMIVLAIPAFIGWVIPYFAYLKIKKNKAAQLDPLIDQKHDEIYEVCEKANGLLAS